MEAITEFFAPAVASATAARQTVEDTFARWTDPSDALAEDIARNERLKAQVAERRIRLAGLTGAAARERLDADAEFKRAKAEYVARAEKKLDAVDTLSVAKLVYDEVESSAGKMADQLRAVGQHELQGYGYQSKMLASLSLTLDAVRSAVVANAPFQKPLATLEAEINDTGATDAAAVIPIARPFAADGIASLSEIAADAKRVAAEVDAAHLAAAAKASASAKPAAKQEDLDTTARVADAAVGWLKMLRAEVPDRSADAAAKTNAKATREEMERTAADAAVVAATRGDVDAVLAAADKLEHAPLPKAAREAVATMRFHAEGRLAVDAVLRFSDSMVTVRRFGLVEKVVDGA